MQEIGRRVATRKYSAAAFAAAFLFGSIVIAGEELTPELKKDLAKIESQLSSLEERVARIDRTTTEQGVRNLKQWIKEFSIEAELPDDDATIAKMRKRLDGLIEKATEVEKKTETAAAAAAEARAKAMAPKRDLGKEIKSIVKVPINMDNVSFKKDVAPIVQNVCVRCHSSQRKGGNFDASTFASFMEHIDPGNPDGSHILNLVTGKSKPRMPRGGQARFDQEWVEIWSNWIKQGAKFDGPSKSAPISTYLIDLDVQRRQALASLSDADLDKLHRATAERHLAIAGSEKPVYRYETPNFLVMTTNSKDDAEYIGVLAEALLEDLHPKFGGKGAPRIWRGRFGINVFADRVDYIAFAKLVDKYQPEAYEYGHVRLTPEYQYLAMTSEHPNGTLDGLLAQLVASAYVRHLGEGKVPAWVEHGYSTVAARSMAPRDPMLAQEVAQSAALLAGGKNFGNLYAENVPWQELAPLSAGFFHFLNSTHQKQTANFVRSYAQSGSWQKALSDALSATPVEVNNAWTAWTVNRGGKR